MGGQAVMEGIMMKGADRSAIAVRRADGSINIKEEPLPPKKEWMRWPVIRGVMAFVDSLVTGTRTLMYSAGIVEEDIEYEEEETEPGRLEQWIGERFGEKGVDVYKRQQWSIAKEFRTTMQELQLINGLGEGDYVEAGKKLLIL